MRVLQALLLASLLAVLVGSLATHAQGFVWPTPDMLSWPRPTAAELVARVVACLEREHDSAKVRMLGGSEVMFASYLYLGDDGGGDLVAPLFSVARWGNQVARPGDPPPEYLLAIAETVPPRTRGAIRACFDGERPLRP